jgi:hypothetical protein
MPRKAIVACSGQANSVTLKLGSSENTVCRDAHIADAHLKPQFCNLNMLTDNLTKIQRAMLAELARRTFTVYRTTRYSGILVRPYYRRLRPKSRVKSLKSAL